MLADTTLIIDIMMNEPEAVQKAAQIEKSGQTLFNVLRACDMHVDFRGGDLPESHLTHTI